MDSIHESNRIAWLNDCSQAFEDLKKAKTPDEKSKVASDMSRLINKL